MINWLVIGVGDITRKRVIPAILNEPRSRLAGILTRDRAKAEPFRVPAWTDLGDALEQSRCDAVYVASPVALHAPQAIESITADKHVLCENPMAMNYAEACSMRDAAQRWNRLLGIAYYRRMYPSINRVRELLSEGAIGRPVLAEATSHDWFHPVDGFRSWVVDPAFAGGGPLYDIGSHRIDLMNYLFGSPVRATGQISTLVHPTAVEDNATALIEYPEGVRGMVDVRWHSRVPRDEFRIRGTEGEIELTPLNSGRIRSPRGEEELPPHANLHFPCVENFVSAVLGETTLRASAETSVATDWVTGEVLHANAPLSASRYGARS